MAFYHLQMLSKNLHFWYRILLFIPAFQHKYRIFVLLIICSFAHVDLVLRVKLGVFANGLVLQEFIFYGSTAFRRQLFRSLHRGISDCLKSLCTQLRQATLPLAHSSWRFYFLQWFISRLTSTVVTTDGLIQTRSHIAEGICKEAYCIILARTSKPFPTSLL